MTDMTEREMLEMLNSRPECRRLYNAMKTATREEVLQAMKILQKHKDGESA